MKKIISMVAIFALFTMILSGCYPTGQAPIGNSDIVNSEQSANSQSSQSVQISDKITLDMNTLENIKEECPVIKLT